MPTWIVKIFDATLKMADTIGENLTGVQQAQENAADPNATGYKKNE